MRTLPSLFFLVILAAACGSSETSAQARAGAQTRDARQAPSNPTTPASGTIVLEFEVPDEFQSLPAGSADAVTGFRVGYFRGSDPTAIRTVDFTRDTLTVQGRTARVTLPREAVAECAGDCAFRVQTVSRVGTSAWSEPVPLASRAAAQAPPAPPKPAAAPRTARAPRTNNSARRPGNSLAPGDLERYPVLSDALRKLLPPDAKVEAELQRFRRVDELALAVAISRDYDIPFTTLSGALVGPPRLTARNALAKLRPDVNIRDAVRKSRAEAGRLTTAAKGPGDGR
jgi:hypothetical protein